MVNHSNQFNGSDAAVQGAFEGLSKGSIAGVIFYGTNPVFNHNKEWAAAIAKAKLSICFASTKDETAAVCQYVAPDNHFLESWSDAEPVKGCIHFHTAYNCSSFQYPSSSRVFVELGRCSTFN